MPYVTVTRIAELVIDRRGAFGEVHVDWLSGQAVQDRPSGYRQGSLSPVSDSITIPNGQDSASFLVQVQLSASRYEPEVFAVHLPREPVTPNVDGGARLIADRSVTLIEPFGVIQFGPDSRNVYQTEPGTGTIEVRLLPNTLCD